MAALHTAAADAEASRKAFEQARAEGAFLGLTIARTDPADGPVLFYVGRLGLVREFATLDDVVRMIGEVRQ